MSTPTKDHVELRSGAYADSVTLLQVSRAVQATPGGSLRFLAIAENVVLSNLFIVQFSFGSGSTSLSC